MSLFLAIINQLFNFYDAKVRKIFDMTKDLLEFNTYLTHRLDSSTDFLFHNPHINVIIITWVVDVKLVLGLLNLVLTVI